MGEVLFSALVRNGQTELLERSIEPSCHDAFNKFMQRAPVAVKTSVSQKLCTLSSAQLAKIVTSQTWSTLSDPLRHQFCVGVLPSIHTLSADMQAAVLEEI